MQTHFSRARLRTTRVLATAFLCIAGSVSTPLAAASLDVEIRGARSAQGQVICGLFDSSDTFRKPGMHRSEAQSRIIDGTARCRFDGLSPGRYAVAAFHAEGGELEPTYGFLGKPRQGVAFTNDPSIVFGPPRFDEAVIELGQESKRIMITLKY